MPTPRHVQQSHSQPHCPSCSAVLETFARACPRCQFTGSTCVEKFPFEAPRLERYLDAEGRLTEKSRRSLNGAIDRFEKVFPQTRVYVCVTRLPENADCREFGYWLFNACTPVNELDEQHRFFGILFVIDRANRAASTTVGYGLDSILDDHTLFRLLEGVSGEFKSGRYQAALCKLLSGIETSLKTSKAAWRTNESRRSAQAARSAFAPRNPTEEPAALAHEHS